MAPRQSIIVSITIFSACVHGATGDLCQIQYENMAMLNDNIYLLGGEHHFDTQSNTTRLLRPTDMYRIALDDSFPVGTSTVPSEFLHEIAIPDNMAGALANVKDRSLGVIGALFQARDTLYVYGGYDPDPPFDVVSALDTSENTWFNATVAGGGYNDGSLTDGAWTSVPDSGLSFWLGGDYPNLGSSMLLLDASIPDHLVWTVEALNSGSYGAEVPNLLAGSMVYVPAGEQGMLVAFGGWNYTDAKLRNASTYAAYADMSRISIYDIATHTWWQQKASGDIPPPRHLMCSVASIAPDESAFYIAMYGGWDGVVHQVFGDLHILSLPSFTWINVSSEVYKSDKEQYANHTGGRTNMACAAYKNREMLVVGGQVDFNTPKSFIYATACSAWSVIRILDLSTFEWPVSLDLDPTYKVPPAVYSVVGGEYVYNTYGISAAY
jgi:hypothetical protein